MQDRAQSTQGGEILAFIKLQVAKSVRYVGVSVWSHNSEVVTSRQSCL